MVLRGAMGFKRVDVAKAGQGETGSCGSQGMGYDLWGMILGLLWAPEGPAEQKR